MSQNEKYVFLGQLTKRVIKVRKTASGPSRRQFSFSYFVNTRGETIRVCKFFFCISQKPIYTVHNKNLYCTQLKCM